MQELTEFNIDKATAEILILKDQTAQNIIEIGKRLIKVKENVEHGEFTEWLEKKVDISHRTANNFMKVATTFSNSQPVANLGTRKLLALAGLDEEDRTEVIQENNIKDITTRELEKVVKEKKEIKKQLEVEQEYSNELQEAIKQKEKQIEELKQMKEKTQIVEKEIIKEVEKEVLPNTIKEQIELLEEENKELKSEYEKARDTISSIKNMKNAEKSQMFYDNDFDGLCSNISEFVRKSSKYTYMDNEYLELAVHQKTLIKNSIKKIEDWIISIKKMTNETLMIGNEIIIERNEENG